MSIIKDAFNEEAWESIYKVLKELGISEEDLTIGDWCDLDQHYHCYTFKFNDGEFDLCWFKTGEIEVDIQYNPIHLDYSIKKLNSM